MPNSNENGSHRNNIQIPGLNAAEAVQSSHRYLNQRVSTPTAQGFVKLMSCSSALMLERTVRTECSDKESNTMLA